MAEIGVALSGGGYRATAFGLGVLLYLADAQKNRDVVCVSSVSGGSIANGYVAQLGASPRDCGYQNCSADEFREASRGLAWTVAHRTLWASPAIFVYLVVLVVLLVAGIHICFWRLPAHWWIRGPAFLLLLAAWGWLFQQRGLLAGRAFAAKLYRSAAGPTRLEDIERVIDHVFCATHLNAGEHFYFSGRFVYSYRFGWGTPGNLPLYVAVQSSAAFPGGFPPRWLRTGRFGFVGGDRAGALATLSDGGVYDNMADEWPSRVANRAREHADKRLRVPNELVVVNSSARLAWSAVRALRIPLVGEILALLRVNDVMYNNSASLRMQALVHRAAPASDLESVLVYIHQTPFTVARAWAHGDSSATARARSVIAALGDEAPWDSIRDLNEAVRTTLNGLGEEVTARLMRHGYVLAMANLHVILDYPWLDVPDPAYFENLTKRQA